MKELNFKNYISATDYICSLMKNVAEDPDVEHIIIVPEVYTLEYEKLIYGQGAGSFSVQVKSFNRLFSAYCDGEDVISRAGAILLIKKIVYDISSSLTCFKNSYAKSGFALKMYETVSRLRDQNVDPDSMHAQSLKKNKINDIKMIYKEYVKRTENKYVDTAGKKAKLAEYFNGLEVKQNKYYYLLNFDVLTNSTLRALEAIDKKSNGVTVLTVSNAGHQGNIRSLTVYKARDGVDQLKTVARCVSRDLHDGLLPDSIVIAGENFNPDTVERILSDFDIPFYISKKQSLGDHPISSFLLKVIAIARKTLNREDVVALSKSPAIRAQKRERDAFCRYVYANLVDYKGFLRIFDRESEYCDDAEKMSKKIVRLYDASSALKTSVPVSQFCDICKSVLSIAFEYEDEGGLEIDKVKNTVSEAVDFMKGVYGDCVMNGDFLVDSLRDLLAATEFSLVQKRSGVIRVGTLNDFRGQRFEKAYLLSFNDGVLPKTEEDVALLNDGDVAEMETFGFGFVDRISVLNERYRDELWQLLQNDCDVFASYVCEENGKKSYDLQLLENQYLITEEASLSTYMNGLNTSQNADEFAYLIANRANGKELIFAIENNMLSASVITAVGGLKEDRYSLSDGIKDVSPSLSTTSVSAIQTYYSCPFMYFCRYVLGLKKNEDGQVSPIDVGNIMHATLSDFLMLDEKEPIGEKVLEIVSAKLDENPKSSLEANRSIVERLKEEAVKVCVVAYEQIKKGKYSVKECEATFGREDSRFKTLKFTGKANEVVLNGAIDRIDEWENRARVIDYKTGGGGSFSYADLYYGTKLQLPIYMSVAMENGYKAGGFFYFPFTSGWSDDISANMLDGVFEESDENILAMERGSLSSGGEVIDLPLDKRSGMANKKNALSEKEIQNVCDYSLRMVQNAIRAIENGEFAPSPAASKRGNVCSYCDYAGICKRDVDTEERNKDLSEGSAKRHITKGGIV